MADDIAPELLEKVQSEYRDLRENDSTLARIRKKTAAGSANGKDLDAYAVREGELLAEALRNNVSGDVLPNGKMYFNIANRVLPPVLQEDYSHVADMAEQIQQGMNDKAGIRIRAQRPELEENRVKGLVNLAATADQYENIRKELEGDVVNFSQNVATNSVRKNAEFQYKAGLSPKIVRTAAAGCCKWCTDLAGTYDYATVKASGNEVWQRHRGCGCVVEYDPGNGSRQNVHTKQHVQSDDAKAERIKTSIERETERQEQEESARNERVERDRIEKREEYKGNRQFLKLAKEGNIYVVKTEKLYDNALKIEPIPGFEDYVSHGDPYSIVFRDANGNETNVSAKEYGDILEANGYNGEKMRLIACQTGAGDGLIPTYLAKRFSTEVIAPTEIVNIDFEGNMILANSDEDAKMGIETGEWVLFGSNGRIRAWSSSDDTKN
ncbi:MAG: hypothetical protein IJ600_03455 [Lachnospiraceae bacterium]|nr:hypothetical protein [Lachnospiraceae bacterium]